MVPGTRWYLVPWYMYVHNIVIREIIIVYKRGAHSIGGLE